MKNILILMIVSFLFVSCKKMNDIQLRIENDRDYEIKNIEVGGMNYGSLYPAQISEYKTIDNGKTTASYDMDGHHYSGNINTWGSGKLRMKINKDGSLDFINE